MKTKGGRESTKERAKEKGKAERRRTARARGQKERAEAQLPTKPEPQAKGQPQPTSQASAITAVNSVTRAPTARSRRASRHRAAKDKGPTEETRWCKAW